MIGALRQSDLSRWNLVTDKVFPLDDQEIGLSVCDGDVCDYGMIGCN